jgi:Rad3-related DNA helicase
MVSVNQSVGRLIRNKDDFGCVYLMGSLFFSSRYNLSQWILNGMNYIENFNEIKK